jgi:hypothetical protein
MEKEKRRHKRMSEYPTPDTPVCYVIRDRSSGLYKIGKSTVRNVRKRIDKLMLPHEPEIIAIIVGDYENIIHRTFIGQRVRREWFQLSSTEVEALELLSYTG